MAIENQRVSHTARVVTFLEGYHLSSSQAFIVSCVMSRQRALTKHEILRDVLLESNKIETFGWRDVS